jgi:hypothetical protein
MKTGKLVLGLSLITAITFASCKKYEEGPVISLRSKKERVANTWQIEVAYNDGEDVTEEYDEYTVKFTKDGDAELAALYSWGGFSYEYETNGTWSFMNNSEELEVDYEDDDADEVYQILKLEEDELWLRVKGEEDELHLMPK